jgi:hypothetical protein
MDSDRQFFEEYQHRLLGTSEQDVTIRSRLQNFEKNQLTMNDCLSCLEFALFLKGVDIDLVVHKCNSFNGFAFLWGEYENHIRIPESHIAHIFSVSQHAQYLSKILRTIFKAYDPLPKVKDIVFLTRVLPYNIGGRSIYIQLDTHSMTEDLIHSRIRGIPSLWFSSFLEE